MRAAREARGRLHNMSAPPRATLSFRPVTPAPDPVAGGTPAHGSGLRWLFRIDLFNRFWPLPPECPRRDPMEGVDWYQTLEPHRRMLAQALAEEAGLPEPDETMRRHADGMPADAVLEALRELALRTDPRSLGLPAMGLFRCAVGRPPPERHPDMRVVVAVLTRRRGQVFLRAADPLPPWEVTRSLDLWAVPEAGSRGAAA